MTNQNEDYDFYLQKIKICLGEEFEKYARATGKQNSTLKITKGNLVSILEKGDVLNPLNQFSLTKKELDVYLNSRYPNVKEFDLIDFSQIIFELIQYIYQDFFDDYPYNAVNTFIKMILKKDKLTSNNSTTELTSSQSLQVTKGFFISLLEKNDSFLTNEDLNKIFNKIKFTLKELFSYFIKNSSKLFVQSNHVFCGLNSFCRNFKIIPYVLKENELSIYFLLVNPSHSQEGFNFEKFTLFFCHLSEIFDEKNNRSKKSVLEPSEKLVNFLRYLESTNGLAAISKKLKRMNTSKLTFLPDLKNNEKGKVQEQNSYIESLRPNLRKLNELYVLYCDVSDALEIGKMNFFSFKRFFADLGITKPEKKPANLYLYTIEQKKFYPTSFNNTLSTIEKKNKTINPTKLKTINSNVSIEEDKTFLSKIKPISNQDLNFIFYQLTKTKNFEFNHFVASFELIIPKLYGEFNNENAKNFLYEILFPFMFKKIKKLRKENGKLYSIMKKNKIFLSQTVHQCLSDIFQYTIIQYMSANKMISIQKFIQFNKNYQFVPLFQNVNMLRSIFTVVLFSNEEGTIMNYNLNYNQFIQSLIIIALMQTDEESNDDGSKLLLLVNFYDKMRREKKALVSYNNNEQSGMNAKIEKSIKKLYKEFNKSL